MQNLPATPEITLLPPVMERPPSLDRTAAEAPAPSPGSGCGAAAAAAGLCASAGSSGAASPRLVGIARLAHSSPRVRERTGVEYFSLPARSALNRESSGRLPFAWTLNPYRG